MESILVYFAEGRYWAYLDPDIRRMMAPLPSGMDFAFECTQREGESLENLKSRVREEVRKRGYNEVVNLDGLGFNHT